MFYPTSYWIEDLPSLLGIDFEYMELFGSSEILIASYNF